MRCTRLAIAVSLGSLLCLFACGDDDDGPAPFDAGPADLGTRDLGPGRATACGFATFPSAGLARHPYLQSTTPSSVRVAWTTTDAASGAPSVRYATSPDGPWTPVDATSELFPTTRTGQRGDYTAHDATLSGLAPDTTYCYEVRAGETVIASGLALHTGWPDSNTRPLTIIALGDSGTGLPGQRRLRDVLLDQEFDVFLHLGDIAYQDGSFRQLEDYFFTIYEDVLHGVPTFPTIGNHEYETELGQPYLDVYYLFEQTRRPADRERYYAFDYGDVHIVSLDSNPEMLETVDDTSTDDMIDWLTDDLSSSTATWKIAIFHHPMYTSTGRTPSSDLRTKVLPVLEAGGIDLVLAGHVHNYERSVPMRAGAPAPTDLDAITYIVSGAGGAPLEPTMASDIFAASNSSDYTFLKLTIDGCTAQAASIADDGSTVDSFELDGCEP